MDCRFSLPDLLAHVAVATAWPAANPAPENKTHNPEDSALGHPAAAARFGATGARHGPSRPTSRKAMIAPDAMTADQRNRKPPLCRSRWTGSTVAPAPTPAASPATQRQSPASAQPSSAKPPEARPVPGSNAQELGQRTSQRLVEHSLKCA